MRTDAQNNASRENGSKSQGPITPEGRTTSSQNSLKHGLTAKKFILLPWESEEEYQQHCSKLRQSYPEDLIGHDEIQLQQLCDTDWQIRRCQLLEAEATAEKNFHDLSLLGQHRARLHRIKDSVMRSLHASIKEFRQAMKEEMKEAEIIRRADRKAGRDVDLRTLGFVFSNQRIDNEIAYQDILRLSKESVLGSYVANCLK